MMLPVFAETINVVMPYIAVKGVQKVHIWGVLYAPALAMLLHAADKYGISVSTDSSGPNRRPSFGQWGYADWCNLNYKRAPVETRGVERAKHVAAVRNWLTDFRCTRYYLKMSKPSLQMPLF
jgi:hypothetical protein